MSQRTTGATDAQIEAAMAAVEDADIAWGCIYDAANVDRMVERQVVMAVLRAVVPPSRIIASRADLSQTLEANQ